MSDSFFLQNISIGVVGKNEPFHILSDEENQVYVSKLDRRAPGASSTEPEEPAAPLEPRGGDDDDAPGDDGPQVAVAMEYH